VLFHFFRFFAVRHWLRNRVTSSAAEWERCHLQQGVCWNWWLEEKQESRAVAGNPRDAAVIFDP